MLNPLTSLPGRAIDALAGMATDALGLSLFDQATRLVRLHTPLGPNLLLAEDLNAWEGVMPQAGPSVSALAGRLGNLGNDTWSPQSSDFVQRPASAGMRLVIHALCADASLDAATLVGLPVLAELLCQDSQGNGSNLRPWHGHIAAAAWLAADGGWARLRIVVEPWLAWLGQGQDARTHQGRTVPQIIDAVFARRSGQALPNGSTVAPAWRWELQDQSLYPQRSLCAHAHESDLAFVTRLMAEQGLVAWWEHTGDPGSPNLGQHMLVMSDGAGAAHALNGQGGVRFTASDHTLGEDSLTMLVEGQRVAATRVELTSRDYRSGGAQALEHRPAGCVAEDPDAAVEHALVDHPGAYAYESTGQGARLAQIHADTLQACASYCIARGPWRRAQAGTWFTLAGHPRHGSVEGLVSGLLSTAIDTETMIAPGAGEFAILAAQHRARNSLSADERARAWSLDQLLVKALDDDALDSVTEATLRGDPSRHPDEQSPLHEAALLLLPRTQPLRTGPGGWGFKDGDLFDAHVTDGFGEPDVRLNRAPTAPAAATAIVVGADEPVHTDRDGRIRIQQHWQRGSQGSHRLAHPDGLDDAPAGPGSHTLARTGHVLAGPNYGAVFTPRVHQETLLMNLGGDADRPLAVGSLYNGNGQPDAQGNTVFAGAAGAIGSAPAWFPGSERSGDWEGHAHDAAMAGLRTQGLSTSAGGLGACSQLVFDDTPDQRRLELGVYASPAEPQSRLQLGQLQHQDGNRRQQPRGHGLDLSTIGHGALRAGSGFLASAHARAPSTSVGRQMDCQEPQSILQLTQDLQQSLAVTAQQHNAKLVNEPLVAGGDARNLQAQLPVQQGLHGLQGSLGVTATLGGDASTDGSRGIEGGWGTVAAWGRPELVVAAPAGVGLVTAAHAVLAAGTHLSLSAGNDLQWLAQASSALAVQAGIVLFTYGQTGDKPVTETGIALHAAAGNVFVGVDAGQASLVASQAVNLASTNANVAVQSPVKLSLTGGGAGLDIRAGAVDFMAPGAIEVHAGMKVFAGGASASAQAPELPAVDLQGCRMSIDAEAAQQTSTVILS